MIDDQPEDSPQDLPPSDDFPPYDSLRSSESPEDLGFQSSQEYSLSQAPFSGPTSSAPTSDDPFQISEANSDGEFPEQFQTEFQTDSSAEFQENYPENPQEEPLLDSHRPSSPIDPLQKAKALSEKIGAPQAVAAALPFSLLIEGPLSTYEKEKLTDLLSRENIGIREVDLEPQFQSERILIPRISEYAGILLVQALRGTRAQLKLGTSDTIFQTDDTRDENPIDTSPPTSTFRIQSTSNSTQGAKGVRISADSSLPDLPDPELIDHVIASATLEADTVEAQSSPVYQQVLDALILELKHKAHRKGATAILQFSLNLVSLTLPSQYRLTVSGSAVRNRSDFSSF